MKMCLITLKFQYVIKVCQKLDLITLSENGWIVFEWRKIVKSAVRYLAHGKFWWFAFLFFVLFIVWTTYMPLVRIIFVLVSKLVWTLQMIDQNFIRARVLIIFRRKNGFSCTSKEKPFFLLNIITNNIFVRPFKKLPLFPGRFS